MTFELEPGGDVRALYQLDAQSIEVVVTGPDSHSGHQTFRITAKRRLPHGDFCAAYEERVETEIDGIYRTLWVEAQFPWADGATVEDCLRTALTFVGSSAATE